MTVREVSSQHTPETFRDPTWLRERLQGLELPSRQRRVYVNRALRMETIDAIGFDLDWTLADYHRRPLERLTFDLALERLIDEMGYPAALRDAEFRIDFPQRGLLIDKEAGTVLSMDRHRYVSMAYLGRERLGRNELKKLYRYEPIHPARERYYHVDTLFELPETGLFAEVVQAMIHRKSEPDFRRIFDDVRGAIDWVHASGPLKPLIMQEPERFLSRDPELATALARLALNGRKLFMLTNSGWEFADTICRHLFDGLLPGLDSWRDLFDLVIVEARKPKFFRTKTPFTLLDASGVEQGEVEVPEWGLAYRGGSLDGLMKRLGTAGDRVLYLGDHIYGDIVSSKLETTWRTALIVRELEAEIRQNLAYSDEMQQLTALRRELVSIGHNMDNLRDLVSLGREFEADQAELQGELEETERYHLDLRRRVEVLTERLAAQFPTIWGSVFKQGNSKNLFASQLESFACLYTSRVSNFVYYGSRHYFRVTEDPMTHER